MKNSFPKQRANSFQSKSHHKLLHSSVSSINETTRTTLEMIDQSQRRKYQMKNDLYKYVNLLPTAIMKFKIEDIYIDEAKRKVRLRKSMHEKNSTLIKRGMQGGFKVERDSYYTENNEIMTCQEFMQNYEKLKRLLAVKKY